MRRVHKQGDDGSRRVHIVRQLHALRRYLHIQICHIERIGDGGYQGPKAARAAAKTGCWTIEIVGRRPTAVGFEVLPKRWIVERTFAWLSRFRRLARDFERYARTVAAFIRLAMIRIMLKRLVANPSS
jgi:putative transposase